MQNLDPIKHPRGSSPPPTQVEQELNGNERSFWSIEQDPPYMRTNTPGKLYALESGPRDHTKGDNCWQDNGGESG